MTKKQAQIIFALAHSNMNISETARRLFYNRMTLIYHIKKIKEATRLDPLDFFDLGKLYSIAWAILIVDDELE